MVDRVKLHLYVTAIVIAMILLYVAPLVFPNLVSQRAGRELA